MNKPTTDELEVEQTHPETYQTLEEVVRAAKPRNVPIRVGVNSGSLEKDLLERFGEATPEALVGLLATNGGNAAVLSAEGGLFDTIAGERDARLVEQEREAPKPETAAKVRSSCSSIAAPAAPAGARGRRAPRVGGCV